MEMAPAARFSKEASRGHVQTSRGRRMDRLGGCARLGHIRGPKKKNAPRSMNARPASHCVYSSGLGPVSAVLRAGANLLN